MLSIRFKNQLSLIAIVSIVIKPYLKVISYSQPVAETIQQKRLFPPKVEYIKNTTLSNHDFSNFDIERFKKKYNYIMNISSKLFVSLQLIIENRNHATPKTRPKNK